MLIQLQFGRYYDAVLVDGERLDPVPSQRVFNHSPDGFSWGYGGSGPAQLALALLLHAGLSDEDAVLLHQEFKDQHVATWQGENNTIEMDVAGWAQRELASRVT